MLWKLASAGYKRRVMKSCTAEERRAALGKLKLTPDELLTIRSIDTGEEAAIRLVGYLGELEGGFVYGVAFQDSSLDF